jgi:preprotein translocase subunit SecG
VVVRCDARAGGISADHPSMNAQTFFRTIGFLIILFLVVYVSIENTQTIDFHFSMLVDKPVRASAAIIYFAMFAVGVVGGTLLHNSGGKSGGRGEGSSKKK